MLATAVSASLSGIDGQRVVVEVHVGGGLPAFHVVGLPDASCREARDRVRSAIISSGQRWPGGRITVNLAPTAIRKEGAGLDLAIAVGILAATHDCPLKPARLDGVGLVGELGLDGTVRPVPGTLSLVGALDTESVVVAPSVAHEAGLVGGPQVRACANLVEVVDALQDLEPWPALPTRPASRNRPWLPDLVDVRGHPLARHALEIAAAGGHNLLFVGPPGSGKSMLARRMPGVLPDLDPDTALVASQIHSVAGLGLPPGQLMSVPPFRAPHHSASMAALIGGGSARIRPGEISCSHGGVLFLDELGEFSPQVLDAMRQPIEEGVVRISRAHGSVTFPARFCLVAAMNPCPCGLSGSAQSCRCSDAARKRYVRRLSGPLLDRIDLRVHMNRPTSASLLGQPDGEATAAVRARVLAARERARDRGVEANAFIAPQRLDEIAPLDATAKAMLIGALECGRLSARGLSRVRMVARTVADLAGLADIDDASIATALHMRARPAVFDAVGAGHV